MVGPTPDKADQHLMDCWRAFGQRRRSSLVHQTSLLTGKTPTTTCTTCQSNATPDNNEILFFICWYKCQQFNIELIIGILVIVFMHCIHHCSVCDRWIASQHLKPPPIKPSDPCGYFPLAHKNGDKIIEQRWSYMTDTIMRWGQLCMYLWLFLLIRLEKLEISSVKIVWLF